MVGSVAGTLGAAPGVAAGSPRCTGSGGCGAGTKSTLMLWIGGNRSACGVGNSSRPANNNRCRRQDAPTPRGKSFARCNAEIAEAGITPSPLALTVGSIVTDGGRKDGFRQNEDNDTQDPRATVRQIGDEWKRCFVRRPPQLCPIGQTESTISRIDSENPAKSLAGLFFGVELFRGSRSRPDLAAV